MSRFSIVVSPVSVLDGWQGYTDIRTAELAGGQFQFATIGRDEFRDNGESEAMPLHPLVAPGPALNQPGPLRRIDTRAVVLDPQPQPGPRAARLHSAAAHANLPAAILECVV